MIGSLIFLAGLIVGMAWMSFKESRRRTRLMQDYMLSLLIEGGKQPSFTMEEFYDMVVKRFCFEPVLAQVYMIADKLEELNLLKVRFVKIDGRTRKQVFRDDTCFTK